MPVELAEAPVRISTIDLYSGITPERKSFGPDELRDEFNNKDDVLLIKPLESFGNRIAKIRAPFGESISEWEEKTKKALEEDFEYLSRTRDLEVDTEKTKILQSIVDKMVGAEEAETRVVLMRRSGLVEAFVYPDGTVFASQELLNQLDTLDEVASVLAHELSHLKFQTSFRVAQSGPITEFGVEWIHEAACDQRTKNLLEDAGFNSLAFSSAIEKIQGFESRGTKHQSGLARASQSVGAHFFLDSRTSHIEQTKIAGEYGILHEQAARTNVEIATELIESMTGDELKGVLEKLHLRDFGEVYKPLMEKRRSNYEKLIVANEIIISRLVSNGYSQGEATLFLLSLQDHGSSLKDSYLINTLEKFQNALGELEKVESIERWRSIYKDIFGTMPKEFKSASLQILNLLLGNMYDIALNPDGEGVPVTEQTLLDALEKISKLESDNQGHSNAITHILSIYIKLAFVTRDFDMGKGEFKETVDADKVRAFLEEVKRRNISFIPVTFKREYSYYASKDTVKEVIDILQEVFNINLEKEEYDPYKSIDTAFEIFGSGIMEQERVGSILNFLETFREYLDQNRVDDQKRQEYINYIDQKIGRLNLHSDIDLRNYLEASYVSGSKLDQPKDEIGRMQNDRLMKFNLRLIMALGIYKQDGVEFYAALEKAFSELNLDPNTLSQTALINLCQPLFASQEGTSALCYVSGRPAWLVDSGFGYRSRTTIVNDYDHFTKLSFIQTIIEKGTEFNFRNFAQLNQGVKEVLTKLHFRQFEESNRIRDYGLFDDKLLNLILGKAFLENAKKLLEVGASEDEYPQIYEFVSNYYPNGTKKDEILRQLNKHYLNSPNVSINDKTNYLLRFFEQVGPEGMVIVADQIQDIETYRRFRERIERKFQEYLDGAGIVTKVAAADVITSNLTKNFKDLIETCKSGDLDQKDISTQMAIYWFHYALTYGGRDRVEYDSGKAKFILGTLTRESFRSLADVFSNAKNLSPLQRFAMAHKALTDVGGALTSNENRGILADTLISSLRLKKGFIASAIKAACLEGDPKFISFPAANLLSSLLFKAFNINSVDIKKVANFEIEDRTYTKKKVKEIIPESDIKRVLSSDTRDISIFGSQYKDSPQSLAAQLAQESDQLYFEITSYLDRTLGINIGSAGNIENGASKSELNPSIEAVIKGVEATGALGIRSLQLASQFQRFSPAVERRLAESFDSNPGLNKLLFWENLNKLAGENPEIEEFVKRITLKEYLGGGSLQTTYSAIYTDEDGAKREVIVKMKNPNVEAFIKQAYTISHNVLEVVSQDKSVSGAAQYARIGMLLTDLAQNWCLADINDKTFEADDDLFRQTVSGFNQYVGREQFYAPERIFTTSKVKSEDLAKGRTVNQILNDNSIDAQTKSRIVDSISRFFIYQLKKGSFVDEDEARFYLIHSDPHIGNYIVDTSDVDLAVGVIDRSLYLRLGEKDINVLGKLITTSNSTDFVWSFVNRVLDINKVRGPERSKAQRRVIGNLAKEVAYQLFHGSFNKTLLLRSILTELSKEQLDVPLNLRLMIRNIGAFQELGKRYGVDFEALYKQAA